MTPSHYLVVDYQDRQPDYPPLFQSTFMRLTRRSILPKKMAKSAARESIGAKVLVQGDGLDVVNHLDLWTRPVP